jgi:FAD/FMN-containing dehydrogenase
VAAAAGLRISPPESTTGSIVALAAVGPERLAYGGPRDMLLGLQYIDSSGSMVSTGGKVMKNVAGYDMTRLLNGSLGTLGFITEATWKVATRPETCRMVAAVGSFGEVLCRGHQDRYLQSATRFLSPLSRQGWQPGN